MNNDMNRLNSINSYKNQNILLIFGGKSSEHEISIKSAKAIYRALIKLNFNVILLGVTKIKGDFKYIKSIDLLDNIETLKEDDFLDANIILINNTPYLIAQKKIDKKTEAISEKTEGISEILYKYKIDVAFPYIHGTQGEDGVIQSFLEMLKIPYTGSNSYASFCSIDKDLTRYMTSNIIKSPVYLVFNKYEIEDIDNKYYFDEIIDKLKKKQDDEYGAQDITLQQNIKSQQDENNIKNNNKSEIKSLIIKPARSGSSCGINIAKNQIELNYAIKDALRYDDKILIEQVIENWIELEVAILGSSINPKSANNIAEIEVKKEHEFYTYDAKYKSDGAILRIPARIQKDIQEYIKNKSIQIYKKIQCNGLARVDFLMSKDSEQIYFNEINTAPGFTEISMFPKLWELDNILIEDIVKSLIKNINQFAI